MLEHFSETATDALSEFFDSFRPRCQNFIFHHSLMNRQIRMILRQAPAHIAGANKCNKNNMSIELPARQGVHEFFAGNFDALVD